MIEFRPGSLCHRGRPRFVYPPRQVLDICETWLKQAPKMNEEERKVASTMIKYLITPPIVVPPDQLTL